MRFVALFVLVATAWGADSAFIENAKELSAALQAKEADDAEALIEKLVEGYAAADAKEKKEAIKAIGKAVASKEESTRHAAMDALAKLKASGSSKYLKRWMTPPAKHIGSESQFKALQCAGAIADKKTSRSSAPDALACRPKPTRKRLKSSRYATRCTRCRWRLSTKLKRSVCQSSFGRVRSKRLALGGCGFVGASSTT